VKQKKGGTCWLGSDRIGGNGEREQELCDQWRVETRERRDVTLERRDVTLERTDVTRDKWNATR
jgi:hypothetical protein